MVIAEACPNCGAVIRDPWDDEYKKHCDNDECKWGVCTDCGWTLMNVSAFSTKLKRTEWFDGHGRNKK